MFDFLFYAVLWTLALYGLIEIIRTIYYICTYEKIDNYGIKLVVTVKNQENKIEGFCRSLLFRYLAGKKNYMNEITIVDVNSTDRTREILQKLSNDYECIKLENWEECKNELDNIANL